MTDQAAEELQHQEEAPPVVPPGGIDFRGMDDEQFVPNKQAAIYLGKSARTLANWRSRGIGPKFCDGSAGYLMGELRRYQRENQHQSTAAQREALRKRKAKPPAPAAELRRRR